MKNIDALKERETILARVKDHGRFGKAFEIDVKMYLNGYIRTKRAVTGHGKSDVTSKGKTYEIKCRCGELDDALKSEYIIYSDVVSENAEENIEHARVFKTEEFIKLMEEARLIRYDKISTGGYSRGLSIQTYYNSKRRLNAMAEIMAQGTPLTEW